METYQQVAARAKTKNINNTEDGQFDDTDESDPDEKTVNKIKRETFNIIKASKYSAVNTLDNDNEVRCGVLGTDPVSDIHKSSAAQEESQFADNPEDGVSVTSPEDAPSSQTDATDVRFDPPLYKQRYWRVAAILEEAQVKSVVDFGCAECKVIPAYKAVKCLEEITGVDIDSTLLLSHRFLIQPLLADFLVRREKPLTVRLYCGSAGEFDSRLIDVEAVTMIEVIEHLHPDMIEAVVKNIFSMIRPRLVIMTTPNSEYNVVFPGLTGFRHWDHKFEWTRQEFQHWCCTVAKEHGYNVSYQGIGEPPPGKEDIGFCSQMAVFQVDNDVDWTPGYSNLSNASEETQPYELITECIHPHEENTSTTEEKIVIETNYYLRVLSNQTTGDEEEEANIEDFHYEYDNNLLTVNMKYLIRFPRLQKLCSSVDVYRATLLKNGFSLSDDLESILHSPPLEEDSSTDEQETEECCDQIENEEFSNTHNRNTVCNEADTFSDALAKKGSSSVDNDEWT